MRVPSGRFTEQRSQGHRPSQILINGMALVRKKSAVIKRIVIILDSAFLNVWFGLTGFVLTFFQKEKVPGVAEKVQRTEAIELSASEQTRPGSPTPATTGRPQCFARPGRW